MSTGISRNELNDLLRCSEGQKESALLEEDDVSLSGDAQVFIYTHLDFHFHSYWKSVKLHLLHPVN